MPLRQLTKLRLHAYVGPLPFLGCALWLLWSSDRCFNTCLTLTVGLLVLWLILASSLLELVVRPLQTSANLLSALREGDFSIRALRGRSGDPIGDLNAEINMLGNVLRRHRLNALEATALVTAVMEAIDVAVFAIDEKGLLRLANPAGQQLLGSPAAGLLGRPASDFGLAECLQGEPVRVLPVSPFPGHLGSWGLRRCLFREDGRPHTLLVLADLSQALRAEQSRAWQSLVRVLGHELNNSLAPIKSISGSLGTLLRRPQRPADWEEDLRSGLDVIASRAEGLTRFMQAYSRLARLPSPSRESVSLARLVNEAAQLEQRVPVVVLSGTDLAVRVDAAQVGQLLTNLIRNAAEATLLAGQGAQPVRVAWSASPGGVQVTVCDNGIGISNTANLFVPFFTTKQDGSGIGLVLSRQIAENHGGSLTLVNRSDGRGCLATLSLPLA